MSTVQTTRILKRPISIVGNSAVAAKMIHFAKKAAESKAIVLLQGETGAGKDHLAEFIHLIGGNNKPFVPVDCGAIPESLSESELFGHTKGAFTDGREAKDGLIKVAESGTLFFNEIANMSAGMQARFLRVLDQRSYRQLGSAREIPMNTRIIAATNADLKAMVREGKFRHDLYQRLRVIRFTLPPLREHPEDIEALAHYFLQDAENGTAHKFSQSAMEALKRYEWPGNIRELKNVVEAAAFNADQDEIIRYDHLDEELKTLSSGLPSAVPEAQYAADPQTGFFPTYADAVAEMDVAYITALLKETGGNQSTAARIAGITRSSLRNKIREHNINFKVTIE